jgi:hypothetical protein
LMIPTRTSSSEPVIRKETVSELSVPAMGSIFLAVQSPSVRAVHACQ